MKVYSGIDSIPLPDFDYKNFAASAKKVDKYISDIMEYAKKNGKGKYRGRRFSVPYADSSAKYIVLSGTELIHLNTGDGWHNPLVDHLSFSGVKAHFGD